MKKYLLTLVIILIPALMPTQEVKSVNKFHDRVTVTMQNGTLQIYPLTSNAVRVKYFEKETTSAPELILTSVPKTPAYSLKDMGNAIELTLPELTVTVDRQSGSLTFKDGHGKIILSEKQGSRILTAGTVQNEKCYCAQQGFCSPTDEYIYGTGQFQDGYLNIRGLPRRLTQVNTQISIPMIISNKGYGLLWHNYGLTEFNPSDRKIELNAAGAATAAETVDVTSTEGAKKEIRKNGEFTGDVTLEESGQYALLLDVGQKMARKWNLSVDGKCVIDFKNYWLPPTTGTIVYLEKGRHRITVNGNEHDMPVVYYHRLKDETVFRSPVADGIDYVVFAGNADQVISAYRNLSGKAPLMPLWSLGYIHCRERFKSQQELLDNAEEFRRRHLPLDVIVQDWQYWGKYGWNAMKFDETQYPDPAGMVSALHQMNIRLMVSVWSKINSASQVGKEFTEHGYYIPNTEWIDFFNPQAAALYWENFSSRLLKPYQIDAWWQDATEPENDDLAGRKVNAGTTPGERLRNVFPLFVNKTVYEGSRKDAPDKRVFILTRSAFPGQQRYASAVWSGDIGNDWETMRRQLTGGLNYSVTGMPWWTFDAGGFFRPGSAQYSDADYQERLLRWFQMATFAPLQRIHGYQTDTEFWRYGENVEKEAARYLTLRYRLLPYIYSQAAAVTFTNSTILRPFVMDFPRDTAALRQKYEYMFGPSFLVAPVFEGGVSKWNVYLPQSKAGWFDFWTNTRVRGGQYIQADAPLSKIPLFVKAGSVVPVGKAAECTGQLKADTLEIRIYPGVDADFCLYEDEGVNYNYEKGKYSVIRFHWDERHQRLLIDRRQGDFDGMLKQRYFNIVKMDLADSYGMKMANQPEIIRYTGERVSIDMRRH
jgi:alpha-D-xyloside xylohydrolase